MGCLKPGSGWRRHSAGGVWLQTDPRFAFTLSTGSGSPEPDTTGDDFLELPAVLANGESPNSVQRTGDGTPQTWAPSPVV
jgi:hypothetical protein